MRTFAVLAAFFTAIASLFVFVPLAYASNGTIPCAIRWDAVDTGVGNSINRSITRTLSPARFWSRAPWYAVPKGPNSIKIDGDSQAIMDQEITYAHDAGLTCWAYLWYGESNVMQNAWHLQQTSSIKNEVNWVQMEQFGNLLGSSDFASQTPTIISYMQQSNYQTVLSGRPLWFLYADGSYATQLSTYWGNNTANFATALATFRSAVQAAGLPNPYIVMVNGSATTAANLGADAVSNYIPNFGAPAIANPWSNVESAIEAYWTSLGNGANTRGIQTVPIAATGWDTRPRKQHIVNWAAIGGKPYAGLNVYNVLPTPAEFTTELQNVVSYVTSNPSVTDSKVILIYAWDECDEGGNCLIPHYNPSAPSVPDTSILDAFKAVIW
jgi:hypothetical protein